MLAVLHGLIRRLPAAWASQCAREADLESNELRRISLGVPFWSNSPIMAFWLAHRS